MKIVHVLYDVTIDVILTAKSQNYVRIEKRTVKFHNKNTFVSLQPSISY